MIRYFAATDDSTTGRFALEYLKSLLRIAPVRVLSVSGTDLSGRWAPYAALLTTPLIGHYTNVVCCPPARWAWKLKLAMPNLDKHGKQTSSDSAVGVVELYTAGVRNVLLVADVPPMAPKDLERALATALRFQAFVVPHPALVEPWARFDCRPHVVPVPVTDLAAFRALIAPATTTVP